MTELWEHHEEWAEREAKFCDEMVETMLKFASDWQAKGLSKWISQSAQMAYECNIIANTWQKMAQKLRQPKNIRLEREELDYILKGPNDGQ